FPAYRMLMIQSMLEKLDEGWDLVSGWKKQRHDPVLSKNSPSKLFNAVVSAMSGVHLHDFNCGFKAYRRGTAKSLDIYGERHRFLPALAHWDRWRVTEIPVPHHPRKYGKTKYGISRFFNGLLDLITLLFLRRYLTNPLHFFGLLGLLFFFIGAIVLGYFGVNWAITGQMHIRPLTLLSVGSIIVGIQFISIGLIGEMITNANPNRTYKIRDQLE
ncbi:MAG: glycosyltransferase, partial [Chitinivibrionales bacterium]